MKTITVDGENFGTGTGPNDWTASAAQQICIRRMQIAFPELTHVSTGGFTSRHITFRDDEAQALYAEGLRVKNRSGSQYARRS